MAQATRVKMERQLAFVSDVIFYLKRQVPDDRRARLLDQAEALHQELCCSRACTICGGPVPRKAHLPRRTLFDTDDPLDDPGPD